MRERYDWWKVGGHVGALVFSVAVWCGLLVALVAAAEVVF